MTTPRQKLPRAQAELRDEALMRLTDNLRNVKLTLKEKPTYETLYRLLTEIAIGDTETILILKRMDTE